LVHNYPTIPIDFNTFNVISGKPALALK